MQRNLELVPLVGRCPRLLVGITSGYQAYELGQVGGPEEHHRVDVAVAQPESEVQDPAVVVGPDASGRADHVATHDGLSLAHGDGLQEGRGRAEIAAVRDGDVQRVGDAAREAHDPTVGGADRRAGRGSEVDAAVTGAVDGDRLLERTNHRTVDRSLPDASRLRRRCWFGGGRRHPADGGTDRDEDRTRGETREASD